MSGARSAGTFARIGPSMKVPPKRKGNTPIRHHHNHPVQPSMKVPPKRKGNLGRRSFGRYRLPLNESPSEKEGKFPPVQETVDYLGPQ